jgi:hypothetical protein
VPLFDAYVINYEYTYPSIAERVISKFTKLLASYGLFYEPGNRTDLALHYIDSALEDEATTTEKEGESYNSPVLIKKSSCPAELEPIRAEWEKRQNDYGDEGACVIGAGFRFVFNGLFYDLPPQGLTQGCNSWEASVEDIKQMLIDADCEDVKFECGVMD